MQYIKSPVATTCMGFAASMGSFLLMAGEPGMRVALPNARVMVHQGSAGFSGKASDIEQHAKEILEVQVKINELYAKHTGRTVEEVAEALHSDRFMSAEEAETQGHNRPHHRHEGRNRRGRAALPPQWAPMGRADREAIGWGSWGQNQAPLGPDSRSGLAQRLFTHDPHPDGLRRLSLPLREGGLGANPLHPLVNRPRCSSREPG